MTCEVCGKPIQIGDWPCITTIRPHGRSVQTAPFASYFDIGLGVQVNSLGDRWAAMREAHVDYREKLSKGALSARLDRIREQQKAQGR